LFLACNHGISFQFCDIENLAKILEIKEKLIESSNIIVPYFNNSIFFQFCGLEKFANFPKKKEPNLR
jgi:hypothetical protein